MITEQDLREAIAECQGVRNPNANTCIKLAAYYTIKEHLFPEKSQMPPVYSYAPAPDDTNLTINYNGQSEFLELINGRKVENVLPLLDELMTTLQAVHPKLYDSVIRKLIDLQ